MRMKQTILLSAAIAIVGFFVAVHGQAPSGIFSGQAVNVTDGALVQPYAGLGSTVTTLPLSSGTIAMSTATVDVQQIRCNNTTSSSVNIAITDTAGNVFTGDSTVVSGFAIPAWAEDYPVSAGSHIKMVGIKMYANTGAAIKCVIYGKQ